MAIASVCSGLVRKKNRSRYNSADMSRQTSPHARASAKICMTRPMPSMQRCHDFGVAVRRALDRFQGTPRRVVILGTGGISHWVGMPRNGDINSEFDRNVIDLVTQGRAGDMLAWTDDEIESQAGNGALELRNWIETFAAMGQYVPRPLVYVPAPECITGLAAIALDAVDASWMEPHERAALRARTLAASSELSPAA